MAADIVGYSRLIEADETGTLAAIRELRLEVIDPLLAERRGRIVKLTGDGALVEFPSVVDAVACAVAVQGGVAARQADVPAARRIVFRIGINLGDVLVEDEDLLGDGVNVAARLEQLCEPGGVLVSGTAYDHLQGRLGLPLDFIGEQHVKNIARPVRAYRVLMAGASRRRLPSWRRLRRWRPAAAAALVLLAIGGAVWWFRPVAPASAEPSLAVLPFANMSGDPTLDYVGPGVAEDIITVLSRFPGIRVVSRMSSFTFDKPTKVQDIARALDVRYVLEGSVRRSTDTIRVTAQLIDGATGDHVWAERYDEQSADVVALQEDIANRVSDSLGGVTGAISGAARREAWSKAGPSLQEHDYYLRGHELFFRFTADDNAAARKVWQQGLAEFPDSALLRSKIAFTYLVDIQNGWSAEPSRDLELAWTLGREAAAVQDKSPLEAWYGHWLMANLYLWHDGDFEHSITEAQAAVRLVPYDALSRADLAWVLANAGRTEEAITWAQEALRRDPNGPEWYTYNLAWAYYLDGRFEDASAELQKMREPWPPALAAVNVRLGRMDEARATIADLLADSPGWTVEDEALFPLIEPLEQAYLDDLRKAGLPEK